MGETAPAYPEPKHKAPLGALFNSEPPEPEPKPEPGTEAWPNLKFELQSGTIFGRKTIEFPTNNEARLRSVVGRILEVAPELSAALAGQTAIEARDGTLKVLSQRPRPNGGQPLKQVYIAGSDESHEVFKRIWEEKLTVINHPAVQAWLTISKINGERRDENAIYKDINDIRRRPTIDGGELEQLKEELTIIFASEEVKAAYGR